MSLPSCWNCGEPLFRKGRTGPPPEKWCSERCRHEFAARGPAPDRVHYEALRALLDELAPLGLTNECPARRAAA